MVAPEESVSAKKEAKKSATLLEELKAKNRLVEGFTGFISQYGVLPLAIGVVIGNAVNELVHTIVDGLITPLIALVFPQGKLQNFQVVFHGSVFKIGAVANSLISFLIIALVVYLTVKVIIRNDELLKK